MLVANNISLMFPEKKLFEDINIKFTEGNCYGVIGANGAGKSTFLRILSGELDSSTGTVTMGQDERMTVLKQDHYEYNDFTVLETVMMGHKRLYEIIKKKEELYAKADFSDADGIEVGHLEEEFLALNGWDAEFNITKMLSEIGIGEEFLYKKMEELKGEEKVKVLLSQALFGEPDILLMDEPTNHLDFKTINWLENFLINYDKTVIVVSHDRHFLNKVCTHMVDIDFKTAKLYPGNYDFWYESSQLMLQMMKDSNKKKEQRIKELEAFVARFSANASKSKQATSRKRALEKIEIDEIKPSSRKYPFINVELNRPLGKDVLHVDKISKTIDGMKLFENVSFVVDRGDKVVLLGLDDISRTTILKILAGELEPDTGSLKWAQTTEVGYLPTDNSKYFNNNELDLIQWLAEYSDDQSVSYLRGLLGRMLFSGDDPLKKSSVLSGGEKVRCMFSKLMVEKPNVMLLDQPTNHLDLESIESVNKGLMSYEGSLIFTSHDHKFIQSVANKVVDISENGAKSVKTTFDEYLEK